MSIDMILFPERTAPAVPKAALEILIRLAYLPSPKMPGLEPEECDPQVGPSPLLVKLAVLRLGLNP